MHTRQTSKKALEILISQNSIEVTFIGVAGGGGGGGGGELPNQNAINKKMWQKSLFLHFQFLLASPRATVHARNSNYHED